MNLFILDPEACKAAEYHCDKHCVKMILEICQMLYTAWWCNKKEIEWCDCVYEPYKKTHVNHPVSVWIREKKEHYEWALRVAEELCKEYTRRYGKTHKCQAHIKRLNVMGYPINDNKTLLEIKDKKKIATTGCPPKCDKFYCAIPNDVFDKCAYYTNNELNAYETYRRYYEHKSFEMKWNKGMDKQPVWFKTNK